MSLNFDLDNIKSTEFGIGRKLDGEPIFETVSVDTVIQSNLKQYALDTWTKIYHISPPHEYDPSDVIEDVKYLSLIHISEPTRPY